MADKNPEVKLVDVRGSFLDNLYTPEVGDVRVKGKHKGKTPYRWSGNFLIPKTNTTLIAAIKAAMTEARDQEWPNDPPKLKADKMCLQDGDDVEYAGYAGNYYLSASRTAYGSGEQPAKRPYRIIGRNKVKREDGSMGFPDSSEVYSGCFLNAIVHIWAQDDPDYGKRINASIGGIQFWRDGDAFGGGKKVDVDNAFEEFGGDDGFDEPAAAAPVDEVDEDDGGLLG